MNGEFFERIRPLRAAIQFLTVLPVRTKFDAGEVGQSSAYFPWVGLGIGLAVAALDRILFQPLFPVPVECALVIICLALVSGGLHLDGLADTADGFFSSRPRERILEIMRDSRIGVMGALGLGAVLGLKFAALTSFSDATRWRAVILAPVAGRCVLAVAMNLLPYARTDGGLATTFMEYRKPEHGIWAAVFLLVASAVILGSLGLTVALNVAAVTLLFAAYCRHKIGGITGDTLGATCELAETAALVAACTKHGLVLGTLALGTLIVSGTLLMKQSSVYIDEDDDER